MEHYRDFRKSGIDAIGEIPSHWSIKPTKYLLQPGKEGLRIGPFGSSLKSADKYPTGYKIYGQENIIHDDFERGWRHINDEKFEEMSQYETVKGDVLITMMGTTGKCKVVPRIEKRGIIDSHLIRLRMNEAEVFPVFFADLVNDSAYVQNQIKLESKGSIMEGLNSTLIKGIAIALPPRHEQLAISEFLSRKKRELDNLVTRKQKLIELLAEERTAIIHRAVTKGLNRDVKLKASGLVWLGDIPEHWELMPVNYRYEVQLGKMLDEKRITGNHLAPYIRNIDVQWGKINTSDLPSMDFSPSDKEKYSLMRGDLIVCEGGEIGRSAIWNEVDLECYYQKALHRMRPRDKKKDTADFMLHLMFVASTMGLFSATGNLSTIEHLPAEKLRRHRFPFPPIAEQRAISGFIEEKMGRISSTIQRVQREIDLIREYRTALIDEVVTGKIKVV